MWSLIVLLSLCCFGFSSAADEIADKCKWVRNTNPSEEPEQVKNAWYRCIFESVENKTRRDFENANRAVINGLKYKELKKGGWTPLQLPPRMSFDVNIDQAQLRKVFPKESSEELDLEGYFHMTWTDKRFDWNRDYKIDELRPAAISKTKKMWFPIFKIRKTTGKGVTQASELILPSIKNGGAVNASIYLDWQAFCKFNTHAYPYDKAVCETVFEQDWTTRSRQVVNIKVTNPEITKYVHFNERYYWTLEKGTVSTRNENGKTLLVVKLEVKRNLTSFNVQTVLPIMLATILAMLAPLFGTYRWIAFIKVVALILMYLAIGDFVSNNWVVRYSKSGAPSIMRFFEFTMIVTLISLIITLIMSSMSQRPPSLPAPHGLTLIADKMNALCCCASSSADKPETLENGTAEQQRSAPVSGWDAVLSALNNFFFVFFLVLYIIGMLVFLTAK